MVDILTVGMLGVDIKTERLHSLLKRSHNQGAQIGRIFAHWALVFFGQFLENYKSSSKVGLL
jgi:hypothetical protein